MGKYYSLLSRYEGIEVKRNQVIYSRLDGDDGAVMKGEKQVVSYTKLPQLCYAGSGGYLLICFTLFLFLS